MQRLLDLPKGMIAFNSKNEDTQTAFILACWKGQIDVVNLLLEQPSRTIDITATTIRGNNGYMSACLGMSDFIIFLIEKQNLTIACLYS